MNSDQRLEDGVLAGVTPAHPNDAVILQCVAQQGVDGVSHDARRLHGIDVATYNHRHEASVLQLHKVMALRSMKERGQALGGLLAQLLEATKGINDGEVLFNVGRVLLTHGAHCMSAVLPWRKRSFALRLPPVPKGKEQP